jgi:preprotein translocase subunit SecA
MSPRVGLRERLARLRGSTVIHDLASFQSPLAAVGGLEPELQALGDADLGNRPRPCAPRHEVAGLDEIQVRAYALVREAARRAGPASVRRAGDGRLRPPCGAVVEMQTGEGKTLAAVMPAFLNALTGRACTS